MTPETQEQPAVIDDKPASESGPIEFLLQEVAGIPIHRDGDGRLFARVSVAGRHEFYEIRSASFRDWLVSSYFRKRQVPPIPSVIGRVIAVLEARARFEATTRVVSVRVAIEDTERSPAYYVDLGDPSGRAIEIRESGWSLVENPGIEFRRPAGMLPLPEPRKDGSVALLKPYVNLDDRDYQLFVAWLTAAMRPVGPYPPLVLQGQQGSAKSTLARVARLLVDPHSAPLLGEPASTRDLMITAVSMWLLAFDNVRTIKPWLSDALCRLAVGGGHATRSLYTNNQLTFMYTQRPIILNGIHEFVTRGDLIDRSLVLDMQPIRLNQRRTEAEYWHSFRADYPAILGGLLDTVVVGLRQLPSVFLTTVPRMADFAHWGEAVGRGLGWPTEDFLRSYLRNRAAATIATIEESLVAGALMSRLSSWSGTLVELQAGLTQAVGKNTARSPGWPKTTAQFSRELHRIAPQLQAHGMSMTFTRKTKGRHVLITRHRTGMSTPVRTVAPPGPASAEMPVIPTT
jgi:hypothetical protein